LATILIAYELGSGLGHLTPLIAVAEQLPQQHRFVFAVPRAERARPLVAKTFPAADVVTGVFWPVTRPGADKVYTHTLADALDLFGFGDAAVLRRRTESWSRLIAEVKPNLAICDFAPGLRLAATGKLPTVVAGYGYSVPPSSRLLPPLRPWDRGVPAPSRANEFRILTAANEVRGAEPPVNLLTELFHGDATFVCTLPAFDPYARYRRDPTFSPIHLPDIRPGPSVGERSGADVFVYFASGHPLAPLVFAALDRLGVKADLYTPGIDVSERRRHPNLRFRSEPAPFAEVLPSARAIIHHGGLGSSLAGLAAGTPQLALPMQTEHLINARAVASLGAGIWLHGRRPYGPDVVRGQIERLLSDEALHAGAREAVAAVASARARSSLDAIATVCTQWL